MPVKTPYIFLIITTVVMTLSASVSIRDTTWVFRQYETEVPLFDNGYYPENGNLCKGPCTVGGKGTIEIPDENAKIIENDFLRVVIAPSIGGRVMSIYHKESKTEQLYHANTAVPYQGPLGVFYYNHLLVHGGILPTFPGPEHGRTWNQHWDIEIIEDTSERGAVKISYLDDQNRQAHEFNPTYNFPVEKDSKLYCAVEISLAAGHAAMGYKVHFENKNDHAIGYEFWTLTTLAPGTDPDYTALPKNTLIVSPTKKVQLRNDIWGWMSDIVNPTDGDGTQIKGGVLSWFDKSSRVDEWVDEGIMYAYPKMTKDWWGAINLDNNTGVLRIAPHEVTPGMKYWSWGFKAFQDSGEPVDLDALDENRSHIEIWGGRTREFTVLADPIAPGPENAIIWDEYYYPTFELDTIHFANEFGAIQVKERSDDIAVMISSTLPHQLHEISIGGAAIEAVAPADKAMIIAATTGCFSDGALIEVIVDENKVIDFNEAIGVTGAGSCTLTLEQEGEQLSSSDAVTMSSEEMSSADESSEDNIGDESSQETISSSAIIESSDSGDEQSSDTDVSPLLESVSGVYFQKGLVSIGNVAADITVVDVTGVPVYQSKVRAGSTVALSQFISTSGAYVVFVDGISNRQKSFLWYNQ
ncbi:MAG: DUF5107 domain-containing protein [Fibrobacterales bacterium]